jgi:hypothetical protein
VTSHVDDPLHLAAEQPLSDIDELVAESPIPIGDVVVLAILQNRQRTGPPDNADLA